MVLGMVHMAHKVVGIVDMGLGHMEVFGGMRLVSIVVEGYVEEGVHRHMVVVVDNHKEVHYSHWVGMHHGMVLAHSTLEEVVAMKVDHMLEAPPTFDCSILYAYPHCSFHSLQYSLNQVHSQKGENS
ncbi:hypothetical protein AHAS_Ahas20G0238400 [Arachis hypogaea]